MRARRFRAPSTAKQRLARVGIGVGTSLHPREHPGAINDNTVGHSDLKQLRSFLRAVPNVSIVAYWTRFTGHTSAPLAR